MGNPLRAAGPGSDAARGPFDPGPLVTPHYVLTLRPGAAMLSVERDGVWVTRLEYDPAPQTGVRAEGDSIVPIYELNSERGAEYSVATLRPPLVAAFGEPDESRESVEKAFLDALCGFWCSIVRRFTIGRRAHHDEVDELEALEYLDIWGGNQDDIEHDLLWLVDGARRRPPTHASHAGCYPSSDVQASFWRRHAGLWGRRTEADYFEAAIRVWRQDAQESDYRVKRPF